MAIVGGGFCGLSTAYRLERSDPSLRVPVPPEPLRFVLGESIRRALKAQDAWEERRGSGVVESAGGNTR